MTDESIVISFWKRDEAALAESKKAYGRYCFYIAQKILNCTEDSEECLDDVLLAAWNSIPPQRPNNLKTYLGKITRETAIDMLRKRTAKKRVPSEAIVALDELEEIIGENDADLSMKEQELSKCISCFLRKLPQDDRIIFIRRYWYYDSIEDLCKRFDYGKSRVLMKLKRTRDKLAKYLEKEGYEI